MDYRQRIIEEAAVMFRTYGIRTITMDMLAGQMGISKRTIYEVFSDKDEILVGVLKWMAEKQRETLEKIMGESVNVIEAIFSLLDLMQAHFQNMSPAFRMDIKRCHNDLIKKMEDKNELPDYSINSIIIERGIKEGVFRKDIDVGIINKCMQEVAKMSNNSEIFPPDNFPSKDVIRNVYINYLRGISTPKGLELINLNEKKLKQNHK